MEDGDAEYLQMIGLILQKMEVARLQNKQMFKCSVLKFQTVDKEIL